jgi:hypothetical protein
METCRVLRGSHIRQIVGSLVKAGVAATLMAAGPPPKVTAPQAPQQPPTEAAIREAARAFKPPFPEDKLEEIARDKLEYYLIRDPDPNVTKFRNLQIYKKIVSQDISGALCGQIKTKNQYNGYTLWLSFIIKFSANSVYQVDFESDSPRGPTGGVKAECSWFREGNIE